MSGAGARDPVADDARALRTPLLKPRPYYLTVRAYQKARVLRSRVSPPRTRWEGVRILGYHRVTEADDVLSVTPDQFRSHVETLMDSDVEPIALDHALELLERPVSGRYACITFDDATADVAANAVPILRERGLPATIFAPTAIIDGDTTYSWYRHPPPALTWEELGELATEGLFDVQAHSRSHPQLPALSDERASEEIEGSKLDIERRLGRPVTSFCYPAGLYDERDVALVRSAGYRAGITTRGGINAGGGEMGELRRTMIGWHDGRAEFEAKLAGMLDRPAAITEWMQRRRVRAARALR